MTNWTNHSFLPCDWSLLNRCFSNTNFSADTFFILSFSRCPFKRTQNDSVSVSASILYSPVKWQKIPNCSVFQCLWKLFIQMLREKRDDCLQCALIRGWHADNRFCCGVIAARWGVSLPNRGLLAHRRRLTLPSMNKWSCLLSLVDGRSALWTTGGSIESQ